jgi:hypothetical protein
VPFTLSHSDYNDRAYRAVFSHHRIKTVFKLDCPKPFKATDHFTIFWDGNIDHQELSAFMNEMLVSDLSQLVATLFFFQDAELSLPTREVTKIPSSLEDSVLDQYGMPEFARYEIYPNSIRSGDDLNQARIVGWATLPASPEDNSEIGIFTDLQELKAPDVREKLVSLLESTVQDLSRGDADDGLEQIVNFMEERIEEEPANNA